jgi:cell division protease FtsH
MQRPTEDRFVLAESELRHRISVLMGGRAAETLIFDGDVSTGASDDLQRATQIAQEMVTRYGMTPTVGQRIYANLPPSFLSVSAEERPNASESTMREIDLSVRDIVAQAFDEAQTILKRRRSDLDAGAELLLTKEVLTADEFPAIRRAADSLGLAKRLSDRLRGVRLRSIRRSLTRRRVAGTRCATPPPTPANPSARNRRP